MVRKSARPLEAAAQLPTANPMSPIYRCNPSVWGGGWWAIIRSKSGPGCMSNDPNESGAKPYLSGTAERAGPGSPPSGRDRCVVRP